jgi:alkylresorcinol/alkylpyrone synthase
MTQSVKLVSVASAVPPYILEQRDVAAAAHRAFALRYTDFERLARVFKTSGIRRRYAVCPVEWYFQPLGWPERSSAYRDGACQLFVDAAKPP